MCTCLIKHRRRLLLSRSVCAWRRACSTAHTGVRVALHCGRLRHGALRSTVFGAWKTEVSSVLAARHAASRMHERQKIRLCKLTMWRWRVASVQARTRRSAWHAALGRMERDSERHTLAIATKAWADACAVAICQRRRVAEFVEQSRLRTVGSVWASWQRMATEHMVEQQQHEDAANAWLLRVLSKTFGLWQHAALTAKRKNRQAAACADRLRSRAMAASFYAWVLETSTSRHRHRLCQGECSCITRAAGPYAVP